MHAHIVVDLGFGDAGKGLLTDFLVRHFKAGLVVRYNGGAQAGHNVIVPDGRHHTFSQFGSGTFVPGTRTYLSKHVVIHPGALLVEGDTLKSEGVGDAFSRLRVSEQALVITPYHQAANHIREMLRGTDRHGSCGIGVGEAVEDALLDFEGSVRAGDLANPALLRRKLKSIREKKLQELGRFHENHPLRDSLTHEWEVFERDDVMDAWISSISPINELGLVVSDSILEGWLRETETVIFEGAQGVLLDEDAGFHPYTTWSRCTAENALDLIAEMAPKSDIHKIGVMRCCAVRHGPGPLPTETNALNSVLSEHNKHNEWQGAIRYGWFDAVLARYALTVTGGVDSLAVTHLDILPNIKTWKYCSAYQGLRVADNILLDPIASNEALTSFQLPRTLSISQRAQFTQALSAVTPLLETCEAKDEEVLRRIEELIEYPVGIIAHGPSAENVQFQK